MANGVKRAWLRKHTAVPDNHTDWATRVLTVLVALVLVAVYVLLGKLGELEAFVEASRQQRQEFQEEQRIRSCVILDQLEVTTAQLESLKC